MNVRVHNNGIPVHRRSRRPFFVAIVGVLLVINLMMGLLVSVGGGKFHVLDLKLSSEYLTVYIDDVYVLTPDIATRGNGEVVFAWQSDDPQTVAVDDMGRLTALQEGKTVITVTESLTGKSARCTVTVLGLSELTVSKREFLLGVGETATIDAFAINGNTIEYTSNDTGIVTIDASGKLTAVAPGIANVTVSSTGCEDGACVVTVENAPTKVEFATSLDICAGEKRTVAVTPGEGEHCSAFTLSSDSGIIEITPDGTLTGLTPGTAQLTATAYNGVTGTATVTVKKAPSSLSMSAADESIYTGDQVQLVPKDNTGCCQQFSYSSADPSIATVDESGKVTGVKKGTVTLSCETYNGVKASCDVSISIVDYTREYTSARVIMNANDLAAAYPELITTGSIGKSTCGSDIVLMTLGKGAKKALVTGGIHAREDITINFVMRCVELYAETYYSKTGKLGTFSLKKLLDEWTLYVVPAMNPDGTDIANAGLKPLWTDAELTETENFDYKNTATGVNLNRNFPFYWGYQDPAINTTTPDIDSYAGASEASEPETQAIIKLCEQNAFEWLFSFHIKGNMIYWTDSITPPAEKAQLLSNRLTVNCKYNLMRNSTITGASGGLENWFRAEYNKPGFCVELMEDKWASSVNKYFERKVNWDKTRYTIIFGMVYG